MNTEGDLDFRKEKLSVSAEEQQKIANSILQEYEKL